MMRYFIVSDVHSFYDEMIKGLDDAGFDISNPEHIFVSLGDLFDRGQKSCECLWFVNKLPKERKILIRGNHEILMQELLRRGYYKDYDLHNETNKTIEQFYLGNNVDDGIKFAEDMIAWVSNWEEYKKYEECLVDYYVLGNNLFVHGWVPYFCTSLEDLSITHWTDWYDAVWDDGMYCWHMTGPITTTRKKYSDVVTVFCGHMHSCFGNLKYHHSGSIDNLDYSPFIDRGIVNLDSYTRISKIVNVYIVEN